MASGSGGQQFPPPGGQTPHFTPPPYVPPGGPMYVGPPAPPGPQGAGGNGPPPGFDPISMMLNRMAMLEAQMMNVQAENAALHRRSDARGSIDTRLIGKPGVFSGKEEDWVNFALVLRAYLGAVDSRLPDLLRRAEDPSNPVSLVDLTVDEERVAIQLYYILVMLCKGRAQDKVAIVDTNEGLIAACTL